MKNCGKEGLSLCWSCTKCGGGCSWSRDFTPIKGWSAKKQIRNKNAYGKILNSISYTVKKCPEFEKEIIHEYKNLNEEGMELLARKVLISAGRDYKWACEDLREMRMLPNTSGRLTETARDRTTSKEAIKRFLCNDNIYAQILGFDGEALYSRLRSNNE